MLYFTFKCTINEESALIFENLLIPFAFPLKLLGNSSGKISKAFGDCRPNFHKIVITIIMQISKVNVNLK